MIFWAIGSMRELKARKYDSYSSDLSASAKKDKIQSEYWSEERLDELAEKRAKDPKRYGTV